MMESLRNLAFFCWGILTLLSSCAHADSMPQLTLKDLANKADRIDVVRCFAISTHWQKDLIVTDNYFIIEQTLKGPSIGTQLNITAMGGIAVHPQWGIPVEMSVAGGLVFERNQWLLVFLKQMPSGQYQPIGLRQGVWKLNQDETTGEWLLPIAQKVLAKAEAPALNLAHFSNPLVHPATPNIVIRPISLEQLKLLIQAEISSSSF